MASRMACHPEKWRRGKVSPCEGAIANTPLLDIAWSTLAFICNERVGDHRLGSPVGHGGDVCHAWVTHARKHVMARKRVNRSHGRRGGLRGGSRMG